MAEHGRPGLSGIYGLRLLARPSARRAAIATVLAVFLLGRAVQFVGFTSEIQWGYDLSAYLAAADRVLAGESPYEPFQTAGMYSPQQQFLYLYPPPLAVAVAPIVAFVDDYRTANWPWAALGATILLAVVLAVSRRVGIKSRVDRGLLVAAAFAFAPVVGELVLGNVHLLLLGLLAGAWLALDRGTTRGEVTAGALVGIAVLVKVFPAVIVVWFLATGRYRAAAASVIAAGVIVIATLPVTGIGPWLDYPAVLLNLGPVVDARDALAPTVWLAAVLPDIVARAVVTATGIGVIVWAARTRPEPVGYAVAVAVGVLIAPAVYQHYLAVLVLPMLLAARYAPPVAWVALAYLLMSGGEQEALGDAVWIVNRALPTLGALLAVGGVAWFGRHRPVRAPARG